MFLGENVYVQYLFMCKTGTFFFKINEINHFSIFICFFFLKQIGESVVNDTTESVFLNLILNAQVAVWVNMRIGFHGKYLFCIIYTHELNIDM